MYIHPYAGVLSAYGMGLADVLALREQAVEELLNGVLLPEISRVIGALADAARQELAAQDITDDPINSIAVAPKYQGTDSALVVDCGEIPVLADIERAFAAAHRQRFGFTVPNRALILESVAVESVGVTDVVVPNYWEPPAKYQSQTACPTRSLNRDGSHGWRTGKQRRSTIARPSGRAMLSLALPLSANAMPPP